ncbi:MAG: hypothetical protein HRU19_31780 [Pseudobacteriovorax sp.]|nr:hypothetical protein [Pseudobacteriovorax sp.]
MSKLKPIAFGGVAFLLGFSTKWIVSPSIADIRSEIRDEFEEKYADALSSTRELPTNPTKSKKPQNTNLTSHQIQDTEPSHEDALISKSPEYSKMMESEDMPYLLKLAMGNYIEDYESFESGDISGEEYLAELYTSTFQYAFRAASFFTDELPQTKICSGTTCKVLVDPLIDKESLLEELMNLSDSGGGGPIAIQFDKIRSNGVVDELLVDPISKDIDLRELIDGKPVVKKTITYETEEE